MSRYRKGWAAGVGAVLMLAAQIAPAPWSALATAVLGVLTTYGVVKVSNAPKPEHRRT